MRNLRHFFSRWQNWLGFILVLIFVVVALAAPVLSPQNSDEADFFKRIGRSADQVPHPPSEEALLGTLPGQYDVFHTLVWGTRNALQFGLMVALFSAFVGIIFGAISGYAGGTVNGVMMRIADAFLAFPIIAGVVFLQQLLAIAIEAAGGIYLFSSAFSSSPFIEVTGEATAIQILTKLIDPLMLSLIIFSWMPYARLVNSMVVGIKNTEFIQATRALGASPFRIIGRHLIPNSISPAVVLAARDVGSVVLLQATLTFIKIGGNSPWGELLARGRNFMLGPGGSLLTYWWVYVPATLAVVLFGVSWNLLGDGINDVMSPESFVRVESSSRARRKKEQDARSRNDLSVNGFIAKDGTSPAFLPNSVLASARDAIGHRDLESALHAYAHLINRNRYMNEVIRDLAQIARKFPGEPQVWQVLGDALSCNGESEEARRAYARVNSLNKIVIKH